MDIKVSLKTAGVATAGLDREALALNIDAELEKVAQASGSNPATRTTEPAPDGAQGDLFTLHWFLHFASSPAMVKIYAKAMILAINRIAAAAKSKDSDGDSGATEQKDKFVTIEVLGKEIVLPAAANVIQSMLDSIDWKDK